MKSDSIQRAGRERRQFIRGAASAASFALVACATSRSTHGAPSDASRESSGDAEVTPGEDLMQEHGVLERILLVYDEVARRIDTQAAFDPSLITRGAGIIRRFVEDYHEKNEEQYIFPRLQVAQREVELVAILLRQHQRGREVTDDITRMASGAAGPDLARALRSFAAMYRPHAAREDTVIFPAFRGVVGRKGYQELGEQFEDREHELFGERGFEDTVAEVARLEQALGIEDLAKFTPT
jgi:hemerythrin-like domain-containing protein